MTRDIREWKESPFDQGEDETIPYAWTCPTTWGTASFTSLSATLKQRAADGSWAAASGGASVTGTLSASGQVFSGVAVTGLTDGTTYRLEYKGTSSEGGIIESYAIINATE